MPVVEDVEERRSFAAPTIHSVDKSVEVLSTKLDGFMGEMRRRLDGVDDKIEKSLGTYATRMDLASRDAAIEEIRSNIRWIVRLVISVVVLALLGLIFKSGLVHT